MSSAAAFINSPTNTKKRRRQFVNLRTPPKRRNSPIVFTPPSRQHRASTGGISLATAPDSRPKTLKRREKVKANQATSTPTRITPRRKPRTPLYPLRSSRNSPPRFEINDSLDDPRGRGSPLPTNNDFNDGIDIDFNIDTDVEEPAVDAELSVTEKYETIAERIRQLIPTYWAILEHQPASCTRVSERCFIIEEFDQKTGHLKEGIFRHVFRMPDRQGNPSASCDCADARRTSLCLHCELVQQYYEMMPDPVIDGEDPDCFFITARYHSLYFSVATKSGSATRQSQKRTIVIFTREKYWRCKSCVKRRDCPHIIASQNLAAELELNVDDDKIEDAALHLVTARMISNIRSISFLPIAPPAWLLINRDALQGKPFRAGQDLPNIFYLENERRCSCGSHDLGGDPAIHELIIFSSTTAIRKGIETSYCFACRHTKGRVGPDLGEYGLFNWNNKYAFSHELMNNYTAQFTLSTTPFFAFHQAIVNHYLCEESPEPFASLGVFCSAWFGFIRLQQLQTNMQCSLCGQNPPVVIADGVSISFPKDKVSGLRPPTSRDPSVALVRTRKQHTRQTCYLGPARVRLEFQKVLEMRVGDGIEPLKKAMLERRETFIDTDLHKAIYNCLEMYLEVVETGYRTLILRVSQLLRQLFASESILQLVSVDAVIPLERYSAGFIDSKLAPNIPAFGMILQNLTDDEPRLSEIVSSRLQALALQLALQAQRILADLVLHRHIAKEGSMKGSQGARREWELTGCYYGRDMKRVRPFYEGRDINNGHDNDEHVANEQVCQKYYETYKKDKLTGGLMALWCPHLVCLGFHKMPRAEGRDDVFSAILCYFEVAPSTVIYDFACQLAPYCRNREPEFFKNTLFVIDEMHANGHSSCSQSCFLSNYMLTQASLRSINSSAAECSNSGLSRIRKSVSYMNEENAILYTHAYLSVWNRKRERAFQKEADNQAQRYEAVYEFYG